MKTTSPTETDRKEDGAMRGLAVATVTDNQDPEGLGRIRIRLSWQAETETTCWARLATPMAMANRGVYFLPEVGDEVLIGFLRGDLARPYIIGSLWNEGAKPPENNGDGQNDARVIRTRAHSELRFFDGDPASVELRLADDKRVLMDDDGITLDDGKGNRIEIGTAEGSITIKSKGQLRLESRGKVEIQSAQVSIQADESLEIKAGGTLTIEGALVTIN